MLQETEIQPKLAQTNGMFYLTYLKNSKADRPLEEVLRLP